MNGPILQLLTVWWRPEGTRTRMSYAGNPNLAPDVQQRFLDQARRAREAGRGDEARALAEKARALDPAHPAIAAFLAAKAAAPAAPSFVPEPAPFAPQATGGDEMSFEGLASEDLGPAHH